MAGARKRFFSEDEKTVADIRERFLKVNNDRIKTVLNSQKQRQRIFLNIIPYLFQYNDVQLPGFVGEQCPHGIYSYTPSNDTLSAIQSLNKKQKVKKMPLREYNIFALYLIGSAGTIAYTDHSDLDIWVCHRANINEDDLALLQKKCHALSEWAETLGLEANFFMLTPESIREGQIESMSEESSGSAQHLLLIEEFYRSGLLLGGRIPAWWLVPPEQENSYYEHIEMLLSKRIITEHDIIDFGDIRSIPAAEFYGAALWQLNKAIHSPYKSMLKLLLMEAYASEYPNTELLCTHLKREIYEGETNIDKLDSYVLMINKLYHYLSTQDSDERLQLARRCFYFKVQEWLTGNNYGEKSRTHDIMTELTTQWNWPRDKLLLLDSRATWKIDRVLEERSILVNELTNSYRMLTDLTRQHTAKTNISQEDLNILGRRLYSTFERKPGKVDLVNPGISIDLSERKLVFVRLVQNGNPAWLLFRNNYDPENPRQPAPIKRSQNLIEMVAWVHFNGVLGHDTLITLYNPLNDHSSQELLHIIDKFKHHFPDGKVANSTIAQLKEPAKIVSAALFINLGHDPLSSHTRQGLLLTSNRSDPLSYGGQWQNLIKTCSTILITSWGEILTQQYSGKFSLLECMTDLFSWSPISHNVIPIKVKTYCFASYAETITRRIDTLFEDLISFFYIDKPTDNCRYLLQFERYHVQIQVENDVPRYDLLENSKELNSTLGNTKDEFCGYYFDRFANDNVILKLLQNYNKPGIIQLFYLDRSSQADIYVLDEYGSLYTQQIEYHDIPTMLGHYQNFFEAAIKRNNLHVITDMDHDKEIRFDFYPIKKTSKGRYFIELHDKPKISSKHNYFDIKVIGNIANIGNDSFYLYCHEKEFSNLEFGNQVLRVAVKYILQKRQGGERYPIYITDIDSSSTQPSKYKRLQTVQLLNQKKIIEEKLNQTLKAL